jgi:histone-lysine N-methyltransferase SETD3
MVPYADMLNHKNPPSTEWSFNDEINGFEIWTNEVIEKGKEIYDSYGDKGGY